MPLFITAISTVPPFMGLGAGNTELDGALLRAGDAESGNRRNSQQGFDKQTFHGVSFKGVGFNSTQLKTLHMAYPFICFVGVFNAPASALG
jgi:hypothetical protein